MPKSGPMKHFFYRNGELTADGLSIKELTRAHGTPLYIYSASALTQTFDELSRGLKGMDHLICFAMKSNSNLSVLRLLASQGAGMDLVSGGELYRARMAGVNPSRIVFSGVGKTRAEMGDALQAGIYSFNVESVAELDTLNDVAASLGKKARVALRFNPDVDAKTHPYISTGLKKNKFGLNLKEVRAVVQDFTQWKSLELKGLSIHIGSQLLSLKPLGNAFEKLKELVTELTPVLASQGQALEFLDLGGGVGIQYSKEKPPLISDYCKLISKHFKKQPKNWGTTLKILIEPGRTLAGNAGVLVSKVLFRKSRGKKDFLVIDAAMNDLIRPALYQSHHEVVAVDEKHARGGKVKSDIVGPVCESSDCLASDREFSSNIGADELVAILSSGAYGFSMSSNYNSRPRPAEVLVENGRARLIRKRETVTDLIRDEMGELK